MAVLRMATQITLRGVLGSFAETSGFSAISLTSIRQAGNTISRGVRRCPNYKHLLVFHELRMVIYSLCLNECTHSRKIICKFVSSLTLNSFNLGGHKLELIVSFYGWLVYRM